MQEDNEPFSRVAMAKNQRRRPERGEPARPRTVAIVCVGITAAMKAYGRPQLAVTNDAEPLEL